MTLARPCINFRIGTADSKDSSTNHQPEKAHECKHYGKRRGVVEIETRARYWKYKCKIDLWRKMMSGGVFRIYDRELTNRIPCQVACECGFDVSKFEDIQSIFRARLLNCACDLGMVGRRWSCSGRAVGVVGPHLWSLPTVDTKSWGVPLVALL